MAACLAIAIAVGVAPMLGGCARPRGPVYTSEVVPRGMGVIYIYRERIVRQRPVVRVFIDQREVGRLRPGEYLAWVVEAGERLVRVEGRSSANLLVTLGPDDAAYLRITTPPGGRKPVVSQPPTDDARREIADARKAPER